MKIKVGEFEVFASGSIVGNNDESIDFIIDENINYMVRLTFVDDSTIQGDSAKAKKIGTNGIEITFINYNSSLGTGNIIPLKLGFVNGKELYFNYRIYSIGTAGKHLHYTWLIKKED